MTPGRAPRSAGQGGRTPGHAKPGTGTKQSTACIRRAERTLVKEVTPREEGRTISLFHQGREERADKPQDIHLRQMQDRLKSKILNTDPTRTLQLRCSQRSRDHPQDPCCKAAKQTGIAPCRAGALHKAGVLGDKVLLLFLPVLAPPECRSLGKKLRCQQAPVPCKVSGREGWEGTSKVGLRHRYNRKDRPAVGTLSWDVGGFFSPPALPQSFPCDSGHSPMTQKALPYLPGPRSRRVRKALGQQGVREHCRREDRENGEKGKTYPNVVMGQQG